MKRSAALASVVGTGMLTLCCFCGEAQISFPGPELLGRPTDHSMTINVVADSALEAYVEYGTASGVYTDTTSHSRAASNDPIDIVLNSLTSNTRYYYRLRYRMSGSGSTFSARTEHTFHTQRTAGSSFTFTIIADSHINIVFGTTPLFQRTLDNVGADNPDFHLDLGDTFAMDNVTTAQGARSAYLFQRSTDYMGRISHSIPIFLALGNHEEVEGWHLDDNGNPVNSQPVWATNAQKRYFLNPTPDGFYSGNSDTYFALDGDQMRGDYYSWTWGDALFVVIDPFWYTATKPFIGNTGGGESSDPGSGDRWDWTLGRTQYDWLKQTLENSKATFKFLFMHHMTGGTEDYIRGGAYGAPYCEWGGYNTDGTTWGFDVRRPGWYAPVHQLLVENRVSAVFHGHDHEFAYEMRDGIVYQEVPAPSFTGYGFNLYSESNPLTIKVLPNSGHLRVTVSPSGTTVDYVRSYTSGGINGEVAYSYTINRAPLPVQLSWFRAHERPGQGVFLEWLTASEVNAYGFVVERKQEGEVGFRELSWGLIPGNGTTNVSHYYSFVDSTAGEGTWLYRLKQIDLDGAVLYSGSQQVNVPTNAADIFPSPFSLFQNSPNPFNPNTGIQFSVEHTGRATLRVYNVLGQLEAVLFDGIAEAGRLYKVEFSVVQTRSARPASGPYFYRLESGGRSETKKMSLLR